MRRTEITVAISDECDGGMEGFANIAVLPAEMFDGIENDSIAGWPPQNTWRFLADLRDTVTDTVVAEKPISDETAAKLLNRSVAELVSQARQRIAEIDDNDAERTAARYC